MLEQYGLVIALACAACGDDSTTGGFDVTNPGPDSFVPDSAGPDTPSGANHAPSASRKSLKK